MTFAVSRAYNRGNFTGDCSGMMEDNKTVYAFDDMDYIKNRVEDCIYDFCQEYGIDNIAKESQNRFNALLKYIYEHVFKTDKDNRYKSKSCIDINDINLLNGLLEYYIYLCDLYGKAVNIYSFCSMIGISRSVVYDWGNRTRLNSGYNDIYKVLDAERERSLSDLLISGNRPNIGILAVLNHEKGWNLPGASREVKHVVTAESPQQIAERYRARLADSADDGKN